MADNVTLPAAAGKAATREVTYSGETAQVQTVALATLAGSDDAKTATDVVLPAALGAGGGLKIDGSGTAIPVALPSLAAGNNNIGDVDVLTVPAPLSTTGGGTEATAQRVTIASDSTGLISVDDNGGSLTVDGTVTVILPSLAAGNNNIGEVDIATVPADPFGANADAAVAAGATGSIQAKLRRLTTDIDAIKALIPTALGAGGGLKIDGSGTALSVALPSLAAGNNNIGDVDILTVAGTGTNASGQATISSTSATVIANRSGRRGVMVINNQTVPVYIDPSGGTAATTHARLDPGAGVMLPVTSAITAITAAAYTAVGDAKVHYFELY